MISKQQHILIAGGGIGGLSAALAFAKRGARVSVFEKRAVLGEVGAGLQLSANAMHVLSALGVEAEIRAAGFAPNAAVLRDYQSGKPLLTTPLKHAHRARYRQDYLHIHRADLHRILFEAAIDAGAKIHSGNQAMRYTQSDNQITLHLDQHTVSGDILIGADGLHSQIHTQMLGQQKPQFTGQIAWRGLVSAKALPTGAIPPDANAWLGPGAHFVAYYVRGGDMINFVAVREQKQWTKESWHEAGEVKNLRNAFAGWDPRITALLGACDQCYLWGLFDRKPLPKWTDGRAALLGDAAHPMLPFMAQGAAMAIEDAWVLAASVTAQAGMPAAALADYETRRKPRASKIQAISRDNAKLFHTRSASGRRFRQLKLAIANKAPALRHARLDRIYKTNVTQNSK